MASRCDAVSPLTRSGAPSVTIAYSCVLMVLFVVLCSATYFEVSYPGWSPAVVWVTAVLIGIMAFFTVMVHGVVQSLVMRLRGLTPTHVLLLPSGAVVSGKPELADSKTDIWVGLLGPLVHGGVGIGSMALASVWYTSPARIPPSPEATWIVWFGYFNLVLGALNLIPGVPLDGGLVLRAAIRWMTDDALMPERIAKRTGHVVAFLILTAGIVWSLVGQIVWGIGLMLIACGLIESYWSRTNAASLGNAYRKV